MTAACTRLDLLRHAQVSTPGLLCAPHDEPLSEKGWDQIKTLRAGGGWDMIVSSPALRCRSAAESLAEQLELPLQIDDSWREIDFGSWTGVAQDLIWETDRDRLLQLWSTPLSFCAPGGEAMQDFVYRIESAYEKLLETQQGKSVLLITHAGGIRALLARALNIDYHSTLKLTIAHARINRLHIWPDGELSLVKLGASIHDLDDDD